MGVRLHYNQFFWQDTSLLPDASSEILDYRAYH